MTTQPVEISPGRPRRTPPLRRDEPLGGQPTLASACGAPSGYLVLYPDGAARACCISNAVLGNIATSSLHDIWFGAHRAALREHLARHDYSLGCEGCGSEIHHEGRDGSYAATFDRYVRADAGRGHPETIYFNLSNACNLQCVQCDGELSSAIRRHREHLPALASPYGASFFEELREFIPHLRAAEFAGGEPFIAPETFRVLDLIAELAPDLPCSVITNGTQWNRRVEAALERHPFSVKLSLDGATAATYEAIRVGASFAEVMSNLEHFLAYTERAGTRFEISHCLMPDNAEEFPDLLRLAESLGVEVSVSVVRDPPSHSLVHLEPAALGQIRASLEAAEPDLLPSLHINADVWQRELDRIRCWTDVPNHDLRGHDAHQVMWFPRNGIGPLDDAAARDELRDVSLDGAVYGVRVGPHQLISSVDDGFGVLLGEDASALVGRHVREVMGPLSRRFGTIDSMTSIVISHRDDDRVDQVASFPTATIRICTLALRDERGRADAASMLFARIA